jgi:putative membrane protein
LTLSTITDRVLDGIHLKQCVTLYLFALPLTLVNDLGWSTIPIVTVVAFTLMGIEGIADEIEMPFGKRSLRTNNYVAENSIGYDPHDLPLGAFRCNAALSTINLYTQTLTVTT